MYESKILNRRVIFGAIVLNPFSLQFEMSNHFSFSIGPPRVSDDVQ